MPPPSTCRPRRARPLLHLAKIVSPFTSSLLTCAALPSRPRHAGLGTFPSCQEPVRVESLQRLLSTFGSLHFSTVSFHPLRTLGATPLGQLPSLTLGRQPQVLVTLALRISPIACFCSADIDGRSSHHQINTARHPASLTPSACSHICAWSVTAGVSHDCEACFAASTDSRKCHVLGLADCDPAGLAWARPGVRLHRRRYRCDLSISLDIKPPGQDTSKCSDGHHSIRSLSPRFVLLRYIQ